MLIGYGVIKGKYLSIPQNFRVNNIQLDNTHLAYKLRGIQISAGNAVSFVALTNIEMKRASLELHNKPQHLLCVISKWCRNPQLDQHWAWTSTCAKTFAASLWRKKKPCYLLQMFMRWMKEGKAPSISTGLITILLMWKRLTLDCRNGGSRFATIHGKMEPYLGTMLLQSTTKRRNITSNSVINSG